MRAGDSVADALSRTVRYSKCDRRERRAISRACTLVDVPVGAVLARESMPAREFAIVLSGAATVHTGGRITSALLAGDHFGEVALLDGAASPATVIAETPMLLAVVSPGDFVALLDSSPTLARAVLDALARRVRISRAA
ncbi:MAG TPA: cyclic nucleotide-binding domain-containing protein [Jatrophihabitans sp.]|nr:cyclic nucleotide-binding domain-containing protein [Jatrophihabitans sp.]